MGGAVILSVTPFQPDGADRCHQNQDPHYGDPTEQEVG